MTQQTLVRKVEISPLGLVGVLLDLCVTSDGGEVTSQHHRTTLVPGEDVDAHMAVVNTNLTQMGQAALDAQSIADIKTQATAAWTPDVITAYKAQLAAQG